MKEIIQNIKSNKLLYFSLALVGIGLVIIISFFISIWSKFSIFGRGELDMASTGQVGDYIGGLVGAIWSLAGVVLFYLALQMQRKEFKAQREELELQRKELKNQRKEFKLNRITNIIYRHIEIINAKLSTVELEIGKLRKGKLQPAISLHRGLEAIRKFHFQATMWVTNKKGSEIEEEQFEKLRDYWTFHSSTGYQEFIYAIHTSVNLIYGLIQNGLQTGDINFEDAKFLALIVKSNFYFDELRFVIYEQEKLVKKLNEYWDFKNPDRKKSERKGYDLRIFESRPDLVRNMNSISKLLNPNETKNYIRDEVIMKIRTGD